MHICSSKLSSFARLHKLKGFTAIELMVVLAILGVLAAIAMPSFVLLIESMRTNNAMDEMQGLVMYARSEAVRNRSNVVLLSKALSSCRTGAATDNWSCGATVFVDTNGNNAQDAGETTLKETGELNGVTLMHTGGTDDTFIVFNGMGYTNNTPGTFTARPIDNADDTRSSIRSLCLDRTGRVRRIQDLSC